MVFSWMILSELNQINGTKRESTAFVNKEPLVLNLSHRPPYLFHMIFCYTLKLSFECTFLCFAAVISTHATSYLMLFRRHIVRDFT